MQQTLEKVEWKKKVKQISDEEKFTSEQSEILEIIVGCVLYGLEEPDGLFEKIVSLCSVKEDVATRILAQIDDKIMSPIEKEYGTEALPMIEPGETAHNTTPEEKAFMDAPAPITEVKESPVTPPEPQPPARPAYSGGVDPYREPIE